MAKKLSYGQRMALSPGYGPAFGDQIYQNPQGEWNFGAPEPAPPPEDDGGGYGYGGGGGAPAPYDPYSDPVWQAYNASLDLQTGQAYGNWDRKSKQLHADETYNLGRLTDQGNIDREKISGGLEARGLYDSGERLTGINRQQANQATSEGRVRQQTQQGLGDVEFALANALAQINLRRQSSIQGIFS